MTTAEPSPMSQQIEALLAGLSPTSSWLPTWLSNEIFDSVTEISRDNCLSSAVDIPFHFECTRIERHTDKIFSDVFDGRQTPTNAEASEMPSLTLQDLRLGDIVQIQTMLVREHSTPWSGQQQLWWDYTVKFAPVHVTLLARKTL
ncbi:hypothetical protein FKP32DRAFT_1600805 [Trametes sanguinea]|nr:hypothetical protein FKP32DRAFT_1600805 [Trametes sanguinea]